MNSKGKEVTEAISRLQACTVAVELLSVKHRSMMSEGHNQISSWEKDTGDQLCRKEITFIWTIGLGGRQADESIPSLSQYLILPPFHQTPTFFEPL